MEKTLNIDERIKRAENSYYRRKLKKEDIIYETAKVNVNDKRDFKLLKKVFFQIVICIIIYSLFYTSQINNLDYSQELKSKIREFLNYDIDINKLYNLFKKDNFIFLNKENVQVVVENQTENNNTIEETLSISENNIINNVTNTTIEEVSSINQMEEDASILNSNNSFIVPLKGTITSRFGIRNPTTETVPKYHTGIDIGVDEGTVFTASMEGNVILVSSKGDYRKSHKNTKRRSNYIICTL